MSDDARVIEMPPEPERVRREYVVRPHPSALAVLASLAVLGGGGEVAPPRGRRGEPTGWEPGRDMPPTTDAVSFCQQFDGKTVRHRFTGEVCGVSVHPTVRGGVVSFIRQDRATRRGSWRVDRQMRKAAQWLRHAEPIAAGGDFVRHEEARTGLWAVSSDAERWPGDGFFDTREEAIAYGRAEDYPRILVAQVHVLSDEEVASAILRDNDEADEHLSIQDEWSWREDSMLNPTSKEADAELHALVTTWVAKHGVTEKGVWYVVDAEHVDVSDEGGGL